MRRKGDEDDHGACSIAMDTHAENLQVSGLHGSPRARAQAHQRRYEFHNHGRARGQISRVTSFIVADAHVDKLPESGIPS